VGLSKGAAGGGSKGRFDFATAVALPLMVAPPYQPKKKENNYFSPPSSLKSAAPIHCLRIAIEELWRRGVRRVGCFPFLPFYLLFFFTLYTAAAVMFCRVQAAHHHHDTTTVCLLLLPIFTTIPLLLHLSADTAKNLFAPFSLCSGQ
jgi:hypothetical protein